MNYLVPMIRWLTYSYLRWRWRRRWRWNRRACSITLSFMILVLFSKNLMQPCTYIYIYKDIDISLCKYLRKSQLESMLMTYNLELLIHLLTYAICTCTCTYLHAWAWPIIDRRSIFYSIESLWHLLILYKYMNMNI